MILSSRLVLSYCNRATFFFILNLLRTRTISTLSTLQGSRILKDDDCSVVCYCILYEILLPILQFSLSFMFINIDMLN